MASATCQGIVEGGGRCRARPMRDASFCFWHNPETASEAVEARRLGGMRRRREGAVAGAYEFDGLGSASDLRRLLEIAAVDALALENSIARVRAITAIVQVGARLLEVGELDERVRAIEATLQSSVERNRVEQRRAVHRK